MAINVNIQLNGGFLSGIILLTLRDYRYIGEPHTEFLSLQSMFPPKSFDNFQFFPRRCVQIFLNFICTSLSLYSLLGILEVPYWYHIESICIRFSPRSLENERG